MKINNEEKILMQSVLQAKKDLEIANMNFETAEEDLIDYYSYQIKAHKAKLDYLIKKVKKEGIVLNTIEQIELKQETELI